MAMSDLVRALKGALDYTRLYRDQVFVVKLGGEVLGSPDALDSLAVSIALLESLSVRVVVVHGGGPQASELSRQLGLTPEVVAGRRVTTPEVLEVAKMVYAGRLNVDLLAMLRRHGVRGVGLSGIDADLVTASKRPPVQVRDDDGSERLVDFGEVGDIEKVDTAVLMALLEAGCVPVVASLAADASGRPLNVNADTLAEALATALQAKKLIFLTSAPGVLRDPTDESSLLAFAVPDDLAPFLENGAIRGGMRPKVEACIRAVTNGVRRTHIIDGRIPDSLLVELFTGHGCGTMVVARKELDEYTEHEL
jgi:acetylglutamate kinase